MADDGMTDEEAATKMQAVVRGSNVRKHAPASKDGDDQPGWLALAAKLPASRGDRPARAKMFDGYTAPGSNSLTLGQLEAGLFRTLSVDASSDIGANHVKPAIARAFETTKALREGDAGTADRSDFRLLIVHVRRYFELLASFDVLDSAEGRTVDKADFERGLAKLAEWSAAPIDDIDAEFAALTAAEGDPLPFAAFAAFVLKRGLEPLVAAADEEGHGLATRKTPNKSPSRKKVGSTKKAAGEAPADAPASPVKKSPSLKKVGSATKDPESPPKSPPKLAPKKEPATPGSPPSEPRPRLPKPGRKLLAPGPSLAPADASACEDSPFAEYMRKVKEFEAKRGGG